MPPRSQSPRRRTSILVGATLTLVLIGALAGAAPGVTRHHRECGARHALRRDGHAIIWKDASSSIGEDLYRACLLPRGRSVRLGVDGGSGGEYDPDDQVLGYLLAGTYAAAWQTHSNATEVESCQKYRQDPCPTPVRTTTLRVAELRALRTGAIAVAAAVAGKPEFALSPLGAVAWVDGAGALSATRLRTDGRRLRGTPVSLSPGSVTAGSLRFSGLNLSWTDAAGDHSAPVG